jgi:hypothetical protein
MISRHVHSISRHITQKSDSFGLKSADEKGRIVFNSTTKDHLDFTEEELYGWLDLYM